MREFGQDKLGETGQRPVLRERHMRWYEQLVRQAEADWVSPRQVAWFGRLDREHANVQLALDHCLTEPVQVEPALRILVALYHFYWWGRSWGREGRHWFGQALAHPAQPSPIRAMALLADSSLAQADGDVEPARRRTDEGCALAEKLGDPGSRAFGRYVAGSAELYRGDITGAIVTCEEGLAALAPGTYLSVRLNLLLILAIAAGVAGDEQRATAWHKEMLAISEPAGECFHRAYALWALGLLALRQGDLDRAAGLQHEALRLRRGLRELTGTGWSMESLSWVEAAAGQAERAAALLGAADRLWQTIGRPVQSYQHLVPYHDACEQTARQALGDQRFQAAWQRGRGLSTDDAIAFALDEKPRPVSAPGCRRGRAHPPGAGGRGPGRRGPDQQGHCRPAGHRAANGRRARGADPGQARLLVPRAARLLVRDSVVRPGPRARQPGPGGPGGPEGPGPGGRVGLMWRGGQLRMARFIP